jgi:hypothetical protein
MLIFHFTSINAEFRTYFPLICCFPILDYTKTFPYFEELIFNFILTKPLTPSPGFIYPHICSENFHKVPV